MISCFSHFVNLKIIPPAAFPGAAFEGAPMAPADTGAEAKQGGHFPVRTKKSRHKCVPAL